MKSIRVHVVSKPDRKMLYLRYRDPDTGRHVSKSAGTENRKAAEKAAAQWEADVNAGRWQRGTDAAWDDFREVYERHMKEVCAAKTLDKVETVGKSVTKHLHPRTLADFTARRIQDWQSKLRREGKPEPTVASMSGHLKAMLRWAHAGGYASAVPLIKIPGQAAAGVMGGRPLTDAEFKLLREAVPLVTGEARATEWERLLNGLWWSGLRLGEAMILTWHRSPLCVVRSGKYLMLSIASGTDKSKKARLLPIAPEFATFLEPLMQEAGNVFEPLTVRRLRPTVPRASHIIADIGERAGVETVSGATATAHDLRRSFGLRWSARVMPAVLMQLMRHSSITTTMRYYVGAEAEATADIIYKSVPTVGATLGATPPADSAGTQ